jgi:hypothetical protein
MLSHVMLYYFLGKLSSQIPSAEENDTGKGVLHIVVYKITNSIGWALLSLLKIENNEMQVNAVYPAVA